MSLSAYPSYKDSGIPWLGQVPAHWEVMPLKRLFSIGNGATPKTDNAEYWDGTIPWVTPEDITACGGRFVRESRRSLTEAGYNSCGTTLAPEGAIILTTRAPIGNLAVTAVSTCINQGCRALVPFSQSSSDFFYFTLLALKSPLQSKGTGSTFMEIGSAELGEFLLPTPPLAEQQAIAAWLDECTGRIDEAVVAQRALLDTLKEKRRALIAHAVTRGLDPAAPLRDSGIPWLGMVPKHWEVCSLSRVTLSKCDGPFGSGLKSEHYTESGVRVVRLSNIRADGYSEGEPAFVDAEYYSRELGGGHDVREGDILIAGLGDDNNTVGRACVAPVGIEPAMVKADCFRYRADRARVHPKYLATQLSSTAAPTAGVFANGSTRSRIPCSTMATRTIVLPPLAEQQAIAAYLDAETAKLDELAAETERAITLLLEHRTALIAEAVTGKLRVPGA